HHRTPVHRPVRRRRRAADRHHSHARLPAGRCGMSSSPAAMRRPVELPTRSAPPMPPRPRRSRHGRLARFARIALPLAALGLVGLIFAWSRINPIIERIHISETEQAPQEIDTVTMENARFAGIDAQ